MADSTRTVPSVGGCSSREAPPSRWAVLGGAPPGGESHAEGTSAALILQATFLVTGQPLVVRTHPLPYVRERFLRVYQNSHGGDGGVP